jgi:predicted aldo/keto reductase-like oxidoreductase
MMVVERNSGSNSSQNVVNNDHLVEHCHDMQITQQGHVQSYNNPQSHDKPQSQSSCTNCSHCLACFAMIPQAQFSVISMRPQKIVATAFAEHYLSPTSIQLQKPPIA